MKNINAIIVLLLSLFTLVSCNEVLDEQPETFFNEEQIFSSEEGVESAINGLYQSFADPGYHGSSIHGLVAPFSGKFWSNQGASQDATSLNCLPNNTWLTRLWPAMYSTINVSNVIIDNLENTSLELANKDIALGQAYFIRAATYFDLVRYFGGVPLKTKPTTAQTLHTARSSVEETYDLIIADFEKAKQLLPNAGEYLVDRPIKTAANAYLAKVYMTLASASNDRAMWQAAYDEAIQVYGKYALTPTYAELFELGNENTTEAIFEIQYGANGAVRNSDLIRFFTLKDLYNYETFGRVRPNKETYDQHITQYPGDPRIDATFIANSYTTYDGRVIRLYPVQRNGNDGYTAIKKYLEPNFNGTTTNINLVKIRYADVLLMLAEIENELNGPTDAYKYVNEVLTRARNTPTGVAAQPANWSGLTQDEFRKRIMRERQYELLGENHEFFDTRRRGYEYFLEEVVETHNTATKGNRDFVYPVSVKNMLLPIPSNEISGNQKITQADQNPGY